MSEPLPPTTAAWVGQYWRELQAESLPPELLKVAFELGVRADLARNELVLADIPTGPITASSG